MTLTDRLLLAGTRMPALTARDPLGFLAALGVLRIVARRRPDVRLAWDPVSTEAVFTGVSLDETLDLLVASVAELGDDGLAVGLRPGTIGSADWTSGPDPTHRDREGFEQEMLAAGTAEERAWVRALWTDLAIDDSRKDGPHWCRRTPFFAPTGKQSMRTMFEKPAVIVKADPAKVLSEALVGWRRTRDVTGENLDVRALRLAAEQADGKATTYGVPGATWLAIQAFPLFPMGGDGRTNARTVGWHRAELRGRRRTLLFAWPVWGAPLDLDAVTVLLRHPVVEAAVHHFAAEVRSAGEIDGIRTDRLPGSPQQWRAEADALGMSAVMLARRWAPTGAKAAGFLTPLGVWR